MVSEVNQNPERNRVTGGQQSPATNSAPVQNGNGAGIFRIGLTSLQAQNEGLSSLFEKYNKDGDDTISQTEFDTYSKETSNQQQQDITSKSGKRTAVAGVYTVQSGDTLSKIANDFGITLVELYETNKAAIGKDINKINVGLKLKIGSLHVKEEETHEHENDTNVTECEHHSHGCSKEHDDAIENFIKILNTAGIEIDCKKMDEIQKQIRSMPKKKVDAFVQSLLGRYIDMSKADMNLFEGLDSLLTKAGMDLQEFKDADPINKGHLLAKALNANLNLDLDKENQDSRYNKTLQRLRESGLSESEKKYFKNYDFNNLSDKDYEQIATAIVTQTYQATVITTIHQKLQDNENDSAKLFMHGFMESYLSDANLNNNLMIIVNSVGTLSEEDLTEITNTYLQYTISDENTNADDETLAIEFAMQHGDKESIETFLQNNQHLQEKVSNIANYVAENTTDEARKAMLSGIAENAEQIVQGVSGASGGRGGAGASGGSSAGGLGNNGFVTSPLQMSQSDLINAMKLQSAAFHSQSDPNSEIPEDLKSYFQSVQDYRDFKQNSKGMTVAEYRHTQHLIKNNLSSAMSEIIGNYTRLPDKFKPKVLSFFDALDFNTTSELYLDGTDKLRAFMDKYHYMRPQILLAYVTNHPAELNQATEDVKQMLKDFEAQEKKQFNQELT